MLSFPHEQHKPRNAPGHLHEAGPQKLAFQRGGIAAESLGVQSDRGRRVAGTFRAGKRRVDAPQAASGKTKPYQVRDIRLFLEMVGVTKEKI
jgi:hypothetical protein